MCGLERQSLRCETLYLRNKTDINKKTYFNTLWFWKYDFTIKRKLRGPQKTLGDTEYPRRGGFCQWVSKSIRRFTGGMWLKPTDVLDVLTGSSPGDTERKLFYNVIWAPVSSNGSPVLEFCTRELWRFRPPSVSEKNKELGRRRGRECSPPPKNVLFLVR